MINRLYDGIRRIGCIADASVITSSVTELRFGFSTNLICNKFPADELFTFISPVDDYEKCI